MKIKTYKHQLNHRLQKAFNKTAKAYNEANKKAIQQARDWGNFGITHRNNGQVIIGSYRNIVNLGNLLASQKLHIQGNFKIRLSWDGNGKTPPLIIHEGATLKNGRHIPPRRWTEIARQETNLVQTFVKAFRGVD